MSLKPSDEERERMKAIVEEAREEIRKEFAEKFPKESTHEQKQDLIGQIGCWIFAIIFVIMAGLSEIFRVIHGTP